MLKVSYLEDMLHTSYPSWRLFTNPPYPSNHNIQALFESASVKANVNFVNPLRITPYCRHIRKTLIIEHQDSLPSSQSARHVFLNIAERHDTRKILFIEFIRFYTFIIPKDEVRCVHACPEKNPKIGAQRSEFFQRILWCILYIYDYRVRLRRNRQ